MHKTVDVALKFQFLSQAPAGQAITVSFYEDEYCTDRRTCIKEKIKTFDVVTDATGSVKVSYTSTHPKYFSFRVI
jgi:hypothetical protein